jgi:hypothetical protein
MERERSKRAEHRRSRRERRPSRSIPQPEVLSARPRSSLPSEKPAKVPDGAEPAEAESAVRASASAPEPAEAPAPRRAARIVAPVRKEDDARVRERARLLDRLLSSDGRGSISRAADDFRRAGFEFPSEQAVQLQLLEHWDEALARSAIDALRELVSREPPLKRPIFDQRLRRLEDAAEDASTRHAASELRRALRG